MIKAYFRNSQEIEADCLEWAKEIKRQYEPDLIIFIAKSGFLFAKPLADYFDCELIDVRISRPSNKKYDFIKKCIPIVPKFLISRYLISKVSKKGYSEKKDRKLELTTSFLKCEFDHFKNILIVDDSVDTGWSLKKLLDVLDDKGVIDRCKVASYCVLREALLNVKVDFYRYIDTIIITATSRYSREYKSYINAYKSWESTKENS